MKLLLFFFLPTFLFAQNNYQTKMYFTNINNAESHLMVEKWDSAAVKYKEAFNHSIDPFYTDIVNYINSILLSEIPKIIKHRELTYWLNYLINQKRVKWQDLEKVLFSSSFLDIYKKEYLYKKEIDYTQMISDSILLNIFKDDQNIRPKGRYTEKDKISIDSMDHVNWIRFNKFIDQFGFPCEKNSSYYIGEYDIWAIVSLLLRHFSQKGFGEEVIDILQKEFFKLNIPRNILASVYDLEYNLSGGKKKHYHYVSTYIVFIGANVFRPLIDYSEENIYSINKNRSSIYLPKLENSQRNAICRTMCIEGKVKYFFIEPYVSMDNLPNFLFNSEEDQQMLKGLKIVPANDVIDCPCEKF